MPASLSETIRDCVTLARSGKSAKALELLAAEKVSDDSPDAALYHFTLGGLYLEQGSPGRALAHLERSKSLSGQGPEVEMLLASARQSTATLIGSDRLDQASHPLELFAETHLFLPVLAAFALGALSSARALWRSRGLTRGFRAPRLVVAWALWVAAAGLAALRIWTAQHPRARTLVSTPLRSGPGEDFLLLTELPAGVAVRMENAQGAPGSALWFKVRVSASLSGWTPKDNLLPLSSASTKRIPGGTP